MRQTGHTHGLSIVVAPELIRRFSYNGFVSKIAIAFPYLRAHCSRPFLYVKRAHFPHSLRIYTTLMIARACGKLIRACVMVAVVYSAVA